MATGFQCPKCDAYNRFVNGNLADPAIFDESFNSRPFALRAGRNNHRLPPQFGTIRCSNCQRNATLVVQLLANYDDDNIEEYREALYSRYPLVCDSCRAEVEEEITRKDTMARSKALAGWLSQTKGKEQRRQVLAPQRKSDKLSRQLFAWRIRGLLWAATAVLSVLSCVSAAVGFWPWTFKSPAPLLCLNILSLFWAFWDPTYASYSSAQLQGRDVRLKGKKNHITLQLASWTSRVVTALLLNGYSSLRIDPLHLSTFPSTPSRVYFGFTAIIELSSAIYPFFVLRLQRPPAIRLIDTSRHKLESRSPTPAPVASSSALEADLFAGLSFSSKPILTPPRKAAPVFGVSSMVSPSNGNEHTSDMDQMDVDPPPAPKSEPVWLRPQRFFAPEAPTGLENLFEQAKIADEDVSMPDVSKDRLLPWKWWWIAVPSVLAVLGGVTYKAWGRPDSTSRIYN
uniref:Ima1 N-terminal domain-containing protein n=1 Tax=Mycena chlorophos TaxID=658473 RepID=A0ABQ0L9N4_MYCCL|nr:predicted protein [Mycena chlorophos]